MHLLRKLPLIAAVAALLAAPLLTGTANASAVRSAVPVPTAGTPSSPLGSGIYISPWGSAHVTMSDQTKAWAAAQGTVISMIAPFTTTGDGTDFDMPIGSMAGDHLDSQGRIFYPGGLSVTFPKTGHTLTFEPTYIRLAPTPGYSAGVMLDGKQLMDEVLLGDTSAPEVLASGRLTMTGFKLDKVPFHWTQDAVDLLAYASGSQPPQAGTLFGTLTPRFDYVPTGSAAPSPLSSLGG
jgi:hypothetical protein